MTVASQRVQIALYALQIQDAAVARAEQQVDIARSQCASIDENRRRLARTIQQEETASVTPGNEETATRQFKERLAALKGDLDITNSEAESMRHQRGLPALSETDPLRITSDNLVYESSKVVGRELLADEIISML